MDGECDVPKPRSLVGLAWLFHELFNSNRSDPFVLARCCADDLLTFIPGIIILSRTQHKTGDREGREERKRVQKYLSVVRPMRKFVKAEFFCCLSMGTSGDMTSVEKGVRDLGNIGARSVWWHERTDRSGWANDDKQSVGDMIIAFVFVM